MQKVLLMMLFGVSIASTATANFSTNFFHQIAKNKSDENFVLSADSLESVLLMLQYGATGSTQRELSLALCGKSKPCSIETQNAPENYLAANAVWLQTGLAIKPEYRTKIEKQFHGDIETVDFKNNTPQAIKQINNWADKNTQGMIKEVVGPRDIDIKTAMVLANALYFQGFWPEQFDVKNTSDREFTLINGQKTQVPTMMKNDVYFVAKQNNTQLIGLPYRDSHLEMLVLTPEDPKKFKKFVQTLTKETIHSLVAAQQKTKATLYLPKFSINSSYSDLKPNLQALGIRKVFTTAAELNNITDQAPLQLSKVLQKAVIQVDEKGTKAAAVTTGVVIFGSAAPQNLTVDHPFVFAIYDQKSHKIPFMGQVINPGTKS